MSDSATCSEQTEWGRCQQDVLASALCGYHWHHAMFPGRSARDRYYEEKIVLGLTQPTDHYMTQREVKTLFDGRTRADGRRLDAYTKQ